MSETALRSEMNTDRVHDDIGYAWEHHEGGLTADLHPDASFAYEHGQWWATCLCGASWSVVDAEPGVKRTGLDFEQIDDGEEEFHD